MKPLNPIQSLFLLVLIGIAIGGWLYGLHWKRVASGDLFTADEKMTIRLQDQIQELGKSNAALNERIKALTGESGDEKPSGPAAIPELPDRPQKIETH